MIDFLDSVQGKWCHQHHIVTSFRMTHYLNHIFNSIRSISPVPMSDMFRCDSGFLSDLYFWEILIWATVCIRDVLSSNIPSGTPASSPAHQLISTIRAARLVELISDKDILGPGGVLPWPQVR